MKFTWVTLLLWAALAGLLSAKDYKGAELRTIDSYTFGRFEVRMRSAQGSGMLSSFFTYHTDDPDPIENWNEIDIEILGVHDDQVQFNTITPGQQNHVYTQQTSFNPHDDFHTYAFEWTPTYVAWYVDEIEVYRDQGDHIPQLNLPQKIMMNIWIPDYPGWVGEWDDNILPVYAYYNWVKYYTFTPGSGNAGYNNNFTLLWQDDFDYWDQTRWQKADHTWWGNNCDFTPQNAVFQDGFMILCLTDNTNTGYSGVTPDDMGFLHAVGQEIYDGNNEPFILKGLGLGGWLVPEGYMLHIPGYGSPTDIRNRILDLIGPSMTNQFYASYESNYVKREDIQFIADQGFNSIRLPFHYNKLSPEPGVYLEDGFSRIDSLLSWCRDSGMYLILDMHCAPGGQNHLNISDSDGEAELWIHEANREHTIELWQEIASRYAGEKWLGGYDLLNEPVMPDGYDNSLLRELYMDISNAIRQVDASHLIFIEGNWFATDFNMLTPPFDDNMAYTFHKYWNEPVQASLSGFLSLRTTYNVPLWLGETGENSNHWFAQMVQLAEENNIGWNWWTHKKLATTTSPLSAEIPEGYQTVLDFWNSTGPQPSSSQAFAGLMQMTENLNIENCSTHRDVLTALLDGNYLLDNIPWSDHVFPGTINLVEYDMGRNDISYSDEEFIVVDGNYSNPWNEGRQYRNDGVDIENCTDDIGGFAVGWTGDGEWLEYTVNILFTGIYDLNINMAGFGGWISLYLDDELLVQPFHIPSTGGWQIWQNESVGSVQIPAGSHILRLLINQGGMNLRFVEAVSQTSPGDLNQDMVLDIVDVVLVVDVILNGSDDDFIYWAADYTQDGQVDVLDIVEMVDVILD